MKTNPTPPSERLTSAVPSKIGQLIGRDFSPAVFKDSKMKSANLSYLVGDAMTFIKILSKGKNPPIVDDLKKILPKGLILFFHCSEDALTKEEIVDFFNKVCVNVPFKLSVDQLKEIGSYPYTTGSTSNKKHTYWYVSLEQETDNDKKKDAVSFEPVNVEKAFAELRKDDSGLTQASVSIKYAKKGELLKFFKKNPEVLNDLDGKLTYLVVFAISGMMDETGVASLASDIIEKLGAQNQVKPGDVINLGTVRKINMATDSFETYDAFATTFN